MKTSRGALDLQVFADALKGPGMDTRDWISFGTVVSEAESPDNNPVVFDAQGPLVLVKLQPTGVKVVCRVASTAAGQGEGEWHPFVEHDEVIVAIPEGDLHAGPTIIGRLNNEIDAFPKVIAGQDATKNNFTFKRVRTAYVMEVAETYLVRSAKYESFLIFDKDGAITLSNGDGSFMSVGVDAIGFQNADASCLFQIDIKSKLIRATAGSSVLQLASEGASLMLTTGQLGIGTAGNAPVNHGTSVEQVLMLLQGLLMSYASLGTGPLIGSTVAAGAIASLQLALGLGQTLPIAPLTPVLTTALSNPTPPTSKGNIPGVGIAGLLVG